MRKHRVAIILLALPALGACSGNSGGTGMDPPGGGCPDATPMVIETPAGFPDFAARVPADNPVTVEGVALGRRLFYDPILSGDSTQSCASCHRQSHSFGDPRRFSVGIDGVRGVRHAPTIINAAWLEDAFWDGRAASLEAQAIEPVPKETEMHLPWPEAVARIARHDEYPALFCAAFGDETVTRDRVVMAIAQFERTFISSNSKYDRYLRGEVSLTPMEDAGRRMFFTEVGDCFHCHGQDVGFDGDFHDIGLDSVIVDAGRYDVTGEPSDRGRFKSPALRNVMVSAPYMHDGRFATIDEVLTHYNGGFFDRPGVDPLISARNERPLLTAGQIDTLKAFLHTFTDSTFLTDPELSDPFTEQEGHG